VIIGALEKYAWAGKTRRSAMAKKQKPKKRPKPRKVIKHKRKPGIPEPDISAVSDYVAETS
jgi:hypothetical protein